MEPRCGLATGERWSARGMSAESAGESRKELGILDMASRWLEFSALPVRH